TIVGEIRSIIEKRGKIKFRFIHDMISTNRKLLVAICQELIKQNLGMKWRCTARSDMLDRELLELMREAGCYRIMVGLDSGSERMQKLIDKNLPIEKSIQAIRTAMEMSYTISISIIVGFPQEEKRDFIDTINLTLKLVSMGIKLLAVRLFTPYPETQLTREYFPRLQYDDKAVNNARLGKLTVWEETQIKSNPYMFSSFYYIPNPFTPRHVYDFFLWIFFYEPYFRNFLGHLWLNQNEKAGAGLLQWAESNADQIMSRLNPDKLPESLPLMADSFKKFIRDTISDPELAKLLEKMLFFDLLTARNLPDSSALKELAGMLFNTHAKTKESLDNTAKQLLLTTQ
ncbi:MAG: radical SAM protein, partial [Planctomycetes bacterium]|nr:radical SAM protein [Planctomycetota bacterium]